MYGGLSESGVIKNDLWKLDKSGLWEMVTVLVKPTECDGRRSCTPLAAVGHTATTVDNKMVIIFGHNPVYGYLNSVQEYHFGKVFQNLEFSVVLVGFEPGEK